MDQNHATNNIKILSGFDFEPVLPRMWEYTLRPFGRIYKLWLQQISQINRSVGNISCCDIFLSVYSASK